MCRWVSIIPGITMPPDASISSVPSGASQVRPDRGDPARRRRGRRRRSAPSAASSIVSTVAAAQQHRPVAHRWPAHLALVSSDTVPQPGRRPCPPAVVQVTSDTLGPVCVRACSVAGADSGQSGTLRPCRRTGTRPRLHRGARPRARRDHGVRAAADRTLSLSEVAAATGLARPTARRILLTLAELGYVRGDGRRVRPHPAGARARHRPTCGRWGCGRWPARTWSGWSRAPDESCSIAQLDGSDIVYVARVAVPKIIALSVQIGTRFPAPSRPRWARCCSPALPADELDAVLAEPTRSGARPALAAGPRRARRGAARGAGARLGADRRAARPGHPLGRRAAARRRRPGRRRGERQRARRRDAGRAADRASTCRCCWQPPARSAPTSPGCGSRAQRGGRVDSHRGPIETRQADSCPLDERR